MDKRITILLLSIFTSVASIFAQTVEDNKKGGVKKESTELSSPSEMVPINQLQGISPLFYTYPMLLKNNPIVTDFYRFQQKTIYKQFSIVGSGGKKSFIGLGEYISLNSAIRWMPSKRMAINVGGMFSRQFYFASPLFRQDIIGINTRIQYALTNNIRLNIWGQYIFPGEEYPFSIYNSLFPHTGIGASATVNLKKDAEMSVGAEYQYDNKLQQWKLESSGRVSIGF